MKKADKEHCVRETRWQQPGEMSFFQQLDNDDDVYLTQTQKRSARQPMQQQKKRPAESADGVIQPRPNDVLCGKEKNCLLHPGNKRYRDYIDSYQARYERASTKHEKMAITKEIVVTIGRSARFIRYNKDAGAYEELSHLEARDKTSHALRTACKRVSKLSKDKIRPSTPVSSSISTSPIRHSAFHEVRQHDASHYPSSHYRFHSRPIFHPGYESQYQPLSLTEDRGDDGTIFGDLLSLLKDPVLDG